MAITLRDYLFNCYRSRHGSYTNFRNRNWEPRNFTPSIPFTRYIKVPLDRDVIEVPCIYKYPVMEALHFNKQYPDKASKEIYIPMFCMYDDPAESRSSNPLLKKFLYDGYGESNLTRKKGSGTIYLGGEGMILYNDFTPLVMMTMEITKEPSGKLYTATRQIVRINPVIYNRDDILAKHIRTKFITGVLNMKLSPEELEMGGWLTRRFRLLNPYGILTNTSVDYDFKVIIEDFSDFFFIPKAPDVTFSSDKVNELLLEDTDFMKLMDV
jgi:hypothetical protein